ncbi:MAG: MtnX-like HAD-IB family phosphatase [Smithella sp.]|jgi:2,3-diketo-5-methylthio-1-phosphopentane phosphatase
MLIKQKRALILSDFDGTICKTDIGNAVLSEFTRKSWDELDREYIKGAIGSRAAYEKIAPLIAGNREKMKDFVLARGKLARGFSPFYKLCGKKNLDLKIVSDGLDFYIRSILEKHGFPDIEFFSNVLEYGNDDSPAIKFPGMNALCGRCGTCKNSVLHSFRLMYEQIIYIGDGHSDICASRSADVVFAKGVLLKKYREENIPCIPFDDFSTINQYLRKNY